MSGTLNSTSRTREVVTVIDSHTGGEPTRVVIGGGPSLGPGTAAEQRVSFFSQHDAFRRAVVNEPRGSDVLVGALLVPPADLSCVARVIFFNNAGCLGMCGHGTIGVVTTLAYLGRIRPGTHSLETPVGIVTTTLHESGDVSVENVPTFRSRKDVVVEVEGVGRMSGDVAWGGNWFYLAECDSIPLELRHRDQLTDLAWRIRRALVRERIAGESGEEIDHIELCAPSPTPGVHSRNFVLCPGGAYDRSPCGTGTSARLACLHADGFLREGQTWRQESITGSVFEGTVRVDRGRIIPTIRGRAFITAEAALILDPADPCCWGFPG